jgi:hypothetical protein
MTHLEVKQKQKDLIRLLNHLIKTKEGTFYINYALDRNYTLLTKEVQAIEKNVSQELKDLETKAFDLAKGNKNLPEDKIFESGLTMLDEKDKVRHSELMDEYLKAMQEENDLKLYFLDPEKIGDIKIEYPFFQILKTFFKPETV